MPRSDPSSCFSGFESGSGIGKSSRRDKPQQLACDRCRGQKLRCIRSSNPKAPCERCQKAGATCIIDSSVRMGRPRRADKNQSGEGSSSSSSGSSRNPSQPTRSPSMPTTSSLTTSTVDFTPNSDSWLVHDLDDTPIDPTLRSVTVQYLDSFDFALPGETTLDHHEGVGLPTEHYLNPALDLCSNHSIPGLAEDEGTTMDTTDLLNEYNHLPPVRQETMQELSDLNMQLSRQLGAVLGSSGNRHTNIQPGLGLTTPGDDSRSLSDTVVFMMHALQTYHRLLVEILGSTRSGHSSMQISSGGKSKARSGTTSLLSPIETQDNNEDPRDTMSDTASRRPWKRLRSHSSPEFTHSTNLDMPTSLLLLSCHTNLIYLCRDAFAAIRAALLTTHPSRHISLFTISLHNIDDLSFPSDPDLQVIVLIQAVIRMTDNIGRLLGYPGDYEVDSDGERCEGHACGGSSAIPQRLLDLMLRSEANGESPADRVGTKALREEIRGLHELVYRPV